MIAALVLIVAARTGTGDPAEIFRDKDPNEDLVVHGQLRLRFALFNNLDLDRGASPTSGTGLFDDGTTGAVDGRVRLTPSFFIGDELRTFLDVDLAQASLGPAPDGTPWSASKDLARANFLDVRAAGVDWLLPIGVLSIGRMPSHFALGIAANDGAALDDDGGDRADRVALVLPVFGHLAAAAFDVLDHVADPSAPASIGEQAITVGVMKWRAPWEVAMYAHAGRAVFDYGLALSYEWSSKDLAGPAAIFDDAVRAADGDRTPSVRRDAHLVVADAWARFVVGDLRIEGEAFASDLDIEDPSNIPGVVVRTPIKGNPAAFALIADSKIVDDAADGAHAQFEVGAASADPAPGFPTTPGGFSGAQPGDVFGPQVDLKRGGDARFDAARIHPLHRVDLILWRTLLGGVSEAAYARVYVEGSPLQSVKLDANLVYSQAISADSAPGGAAPLGVELDVGAEADLGAIVAKGLSARVDAGNLVPLGGLAVRGGAPTSVSSWGQMVLVRLGYAL